MKTILGKTGLNVGRIGLAASYGAPAAAFEKAFEMGCNYFYLGSGRHRKGMKEAVRNLVQQGKRDQMVIAVQSYARLGVLTEFWYKRSLQSLSIDHADIFILGWHNKSPASMLMDTAVKIKEKGLARFIGMTGHNRSLFPELAHAFDLFHIRYNAAHRGAESDCFPYLPQQDGPGIVSYTATRWAHLLNPKHMPPGEAPLSAPDCYRFALANPSIHVCLCGPKNQQQMEEALTVIEHPDIDPGQLERIQRIGDHVRTRGKGFF